MVYGSLEISLLTVFHNLNCSLPWRLNYLDIESRSQYFSQGQYTCFTLAQLVGTESTDSTGNIEITGNTDRLDSSDHCQSLPAIPGRIPGSEKGVHFSIRGSGAARVMWNSNCSALFKRNLPRKSTPKLEHLITPTTTLPQHGIVDHIF